jgi:RNA polymerase-binding transcription factor DksA
MVSDFDILHSRLKRGRKRLTEELEQIGADNQFADEHRDGALFSERGAASAETTEMRKRLALKHQLTEALAEVERCLHKLDDGTYGLCDNCGQRINPARLEALPQANLCMNCKTLQERRHPK